MRELIIPTGVTGDPDATEMVRFWLANDCPNVSLFLGMYKDAKDSDVDELWAWGNILSDIAQHISNGMEKEYGMDYKESMNSITRHFIQCIKERAPGLEGDFLE